MIGYDAFRAEQAAARAEGRLLGIGLGLYVEPSGIAMGNLASEAAIVRIGVNGQVQALMGSGSHGQSLETTIAQVVADQPRCRRRRRHRHPGRHRVGAVRARHRRQPQRRDRQRRRRLRPPPQVRDEGAGDRRPPRSRPRPRTSRSSAGRISVVGTPAKGDVDHRGRPPRLPQPGRPAAGHGDGAGGAGPLHAERRPFTWSNACHACVCEVDPRTGAVTHPALRRQRGLRRDDQPDVVEGQIAGGVVQGIGGVLYEHMVYDDAGNPLSHDVRRLPAADRGRGADRSSTATSRRRRRPTPAGTRAWGRAAPSARRRPSSTRSPTPSPTSARRLNRQPLSPGAIIAAIEEAASS